LRPPRPGHAFAYSAHVRSHGTTHSRRTSQVAGRDIQLHQLFALSREDLVLKSHIQCEAHPGAGRTALCRAHGHRTWEGVCVRRRHLRKSGPGREPSSVDSCGQIADPVDNQSRGPSRLTAGTSQRPEISGRSGDDGQRPVVIHGRRRRTATQRTIGTRLASETTMQHGSVNAVSGDRRAKDRNLRCRPRSGVDCASQRLTDGTEPGSGVWTRYSMKNTVGSKGRSSDRTPEPVLAETAYPITVVDATNSTAPSRSR